MMSILYANQRLMSALHVGVKVEDHHMSAAAPVLSICLPAGGDPETLLERLEFHLHAFRDMELAFEIVVIDDKSVLATTSVLSSLENVPEVSVCTPKRFSDSSSEIEAALRHARGDFVAVLGRIDQLKSEVVAAWVREMTNDPDIGMAQSPWAIKIALNENSRPPSADKPVLRFRAGQFSELCDFVLRYELFPGSMIVRRNLFNPSVGRVPSQISWPFFLTGAVLGQADIVYSPQPFATLPEIFSGLSPGFTNPRHTAELLDCDSYLGGIEYLVALGELHSLVPPHARVTRTYAIGRFIASRRKAVLERLIEAEMWMDAYVLVHRIAAHEPLPISQSELERITKLAGLRPKTSDGDDRSRLNSTQLPLKASFDRNEYFEDTAKTIDDDHTRSNRPVIDRIRDAVALTLLGNGSAMKR